MRFFERAIMAPDRLCARPERSSAVTDTTLWLAQSTEDVDNFVDNRAARRAKPRCCCTWLSLLKT